MNKKIEAISNLGQLLADFAEGKQSKMYTKYIDSLQKVAMQTHQHNAWMTEENIKYSCRHWGESLQYDAINQWLSGYTITNKKEKTVAIITAGNVPLVGLHDLICVLLSGHCALIKLSSKDKFLLPVLADFLSSICDEFINKISFVEDTRLSGYDKVIATGSNNSSRYFKKYFGSVPNIIRKNRSSSAILNGNETKEQLVALGNDMFQYYGLGCRNVSQLLVPKNYDFKALFEAIEPYSEIINHHKYANNYTYNKAIYLMNQDAFLDNGFMLLRENNQLNSPLSVIHYRQYEDEQDISRYLSVHQQEIQCVVASKQIEDTNIDFMNFGEAQSPKLFDYADNIDTLAFLLDNKKS